MKPSIKDRYDRLQEKIDTELSKYQKLEKELNLAGHPDKIIKARQRCANSILPIHEEMSKLKKS